MSFAPTNKKDLTNVAKEVGKTAAQEAAQQGIAKGKETIAEKSEKAGEIINKMQQGAQIVQQVAGIAQSLNKPSTIPPNSGNNGGINGNGNQSSAAQQPTSSDVAAALMPVMVGYEVIIDGNKIAPVTAIAITQEYHSHHMLTLHFPHELVQAEGTFTIEDAQALLGKPATVVIKNLNNTGAAKLECKFVIANLEMDQQDLDEGMLKLTGYSSTWLLDGAPHYESFTGKNLKEIATAVAKPLEQVGSKLKAAPTFTAAFPFVCRYNESAWNFLKRLADETGQWLYFNGSDLIFGKPEAEKATKLVYGQDCYHMQLSMKTAPVQTGLFDYNASQDSTINEKAGEYTGDVGAYASAAFKQSQTLFAAPAHGTSTALGWDKSVLFQLRVGSLIDVAFKRMGEGASHGQMRIIAISHHLTHDGHYTNTFEAIPAGAGAPPLFYHVPGTHPMLAKVIDNKDSQGRVKVEFIGWQGDNNKQTDWIRVASPNAGNSDDVSKDRGFRFIPEVDDQVLVDFESGNPDKPFVTASMYTGKTGSGGGDNNKTKSIITRSKVSITFDDDKGSLTLTDKGKESITLDGDGNISVSAASSISLTCGSASITLKSDGTITIAGTTVSTTGSTTASMASGPASFAATKAGGVADMTGTESTVTGTATATLTGKETVVNGDATTGVTSGGPTKIEGAIVKLN